MGIDFSHCEAHWSYSGFGHFRKMVAETAGIKLSDMYGFIWKKAEDNLIERFGKPDYEQIDAEVKRLEDEGFKGIPWSEVDDPIAPLLNHSDCEGHLSSEECRQIAPRLREIMACWDSRNEWIKWEIDNGVELCKGMELAAENNEDLEFC